MSLNHTMKHLRTHAEQAPDRAGLIYPSGKTAPYTFHQLTFREVDERSDQIAHGLLELGFQRGMKTLVALPVGPDLFLILIGMIKAGVVPVLADPGMGLSRMLACIRQVGVEGFIGIPLAHLVRRLSPATFADIQVAVSTGRWGGRPIAELYPEGRGRFELPEVELDDVILICFTTGSTGPAKAVEQTHRIFSTVTEELTSMYDLQTGRPGLVTLPILTLVDLMFGCPAVLAPMNFGRPADVVPEDILSTIETFNIEFNSA